MKKQGELTSFYVVTSVLALVGFLILIWFVVRVGISEDAETQACHLSVITRATAPQAASQFVPLQCTTQKVCLKDGRGNCDTSFAGERIREIKVDGRNSEVGNPEATRTVEETLAQEMYSCWKMMGEGKLDLFQSLGTLTGVSKSDSVCVICSRVALDVAAGRDAEIVNAVDLPAYLKSHTVPNGDKTYLQAFTDPSVQSYSRASTDDVRVPDATSVVELIPKTPEFAVVFMQIKPQEYGSVLKNLGAVALGGATIAGSRFVLIPQPVKGVATVAGSGSVLTPQPVKGGATVAGSASILRPQPVKGVAGRAGRYLLTPTGLGAAGIGAIGVAAYATWNVYESKSAAAGYCGEVTVPGGKKMKSSVDGIDPSKGCSMVQVVPYDAQAINTICKYIESAP